MGKIEVLIDPEKREKYINNLLKLDGLPYIEENSKAAYCPISLTSTPSDLKEFIILRQKILMEDVLNKSGIIAYDPSSAPFSPDKNLISQPTEIYLIDSGKIIGARFFIGHNILPSTGQGIEVEKARTYNRIPVILMDKNIRISRMQPSRVIYLQYTNFQEEKEKFIPLFKMLQEYIPGVGFNDGVPVLLGFDKDNKVVDLEEKVYKEFPHLQYHYEGKTPIIKLRSENPKIFYEINE